MFPILSPAEYRRLLTTPLLLEEYSPVGEHAGLVVSGRLDSWGPAAMPSCPVIQINTSTGFHSLVDLVADEAQLEQLTAVILQQPVAAATLVQLLRHNADTSHTQGLFAESLAYSTLQHSKGFKDWLASASRPAAHEDQEAPLLTTREANTITATFNRPAVHNAYSASLKDALCSILSTAHIDTSIEHIVLRGNGPSFCAGGDLAEFGSAQADAGVAHLSRTTRGAGALLSTYPGTTEALLHGACIGAGIELPAFCTRISAAEDTFFQLPEVAMGLVPGAGGTVSITHRTGRHLAAYMALSGIRVDAATALDWGLIDAISPTAQP